MKKLVLLLTASLALFGQAGKTTLKAGDMAPDFKLKGSDGKEYSLSEFKGTNPVVLAFFPFAFTGG